MTLMLVLLCVSWLALVASSCHAPRYDLEDAEEHFECFIQKFQKNYADENEKQTRFQIFKQHLERVNNHNEKSNHAVFGITQFSDLTLEEFQSMFNCLRSSSNEQDVPFCQFLYDDDIEFNDAPESFDWRDHGVITPVKDQKSCGSCYAFSAIGNIESQYAIQTQELLRLSEQQVVDCDKNDFGCQGGFMHATIRWLMDHGGCESEADYTYRGQSGSCLFDASKVKVKIADCRSYNLTSQEKLKQMLYHTGPIAIGIKANGLMSYTEGIISDEQCSEGGLNHGVLLVGYGTENGVPFWTVKNSWNTSFGEDGYFRMQRGEGADSCAMMNEYMVSAIVA